MSEPRHRALRRRAPLRSRGADGVVTVSAVLAAVGGVAFAASVQRGSSVTVQGTLLALALLALTVAVRRYFAGRFPATTLAEPRNPSGERAGGPIAPAELADVGAVPHRPLARRSLLGAAVVLGAALLGPVAALGPRPRRLDRSTRWRAGVRLVDTLGEPIAAAEVPVGGVSTVWPEGAEHNELSAGILVVLERPPQPPTVRAWVVSERLVVYSKVCTHMGCPVGLFQGRTNTLFCPCHQASFDAARGAQRIFGPVPRPLPQLPLGVDADGYLVALGDFREPVGPTVATS